MGYLALLLVLTAAFLHASWNLLAKRAGNSPGFIWLFNVLATVIYAPTVILALVAQRPQFNMFQVIFLVGSASLHLAYFLSLQRGYAVGDLSLSYPLARGTGPLLSTLLAIALLGERPSLSALGGVVLLIGGILLLVGNPWQLFRGGAGKRRAVGYALLTGVFIAAYTIWDKAAVSTFLVSPLLLDEASSIMQAGLLLPSSIKKWEKVKETWKKHRLEVIGVAILSPLAYLLVLFALTFSPVSHVAPLRESSVLIGTFMGTRFLSEKGGWRRLGPALLILAGIILLAVSP